MEEIEVSDGPYILFLELTDHEYAFAAIGPFESWEAAEDYACNKLADDNLKRVVYVKLQHPVDLANA